MISIPYNWMSSDAKIIRSDGCWEWLGDDFEWWRIDRVVLYGVVSRIELHARGWPWPFLRLLEDLRCGCCRGFVLGVVWFVGCWLSVIGGVVLFLVMCWWYDRVACFMGRCIALRKWLGIVFFWRTRHFRVYSCVGYLWCVVHVILCDYIYLVRPILRVEAECNVHFWGVGSLALSMIWKQIKSARLVWVQLDCLLMTLGVLPYCWLWLMRSRVEDHTIVRIPLSRMRRSANGNENNNHSDLELLLKTEMENGSKDG